MNMDMQALIGEMSALIVKIKSGEATQGEIEAFAAASGELHERAVVLRYKSYEAKVFGTPVQPVQDLPRQTPEEKPAPAAEIAEPAAEIPEAVESVKEAEKETAPEEMSFDLFEESEQENDSFDLFSLDESEEDETIDGPAVHHEEPAVVEEPEIKETPAVDQQPEIVTEEKPVEAPFAHAEPLAPLETPVEEHIAEEVKPAVEEPVVATPLPAEQKTSEPELPAAETPKPVSAMPSGDIHPVYKRLVIDDNSLAARLMAVRLETLKGAFGFNERLQIIRELFDGSNDVFAEAIDQLDSLDSKDKARNVVSDYARRFAWDKDSDLALEFVQKVERRYA